MALFRRALRHRPVAQQHHQQAAHLATEQLRRAVEREYLSGLRHLR
jgi:hypothetical protein